MCNKLQIFQVEMYKYSKCFKNTESLLPRGSPFDRGKVVSNDFRIIPVLYRIMQTASNVLFIGIVS